MGHNLILFKKDNHLLVNYDLVMEVRIFQVFFLIFLKVYQKSINYNHDI